jgi:hypothetical protein
MPPAVPPSALTQHALLVAWGTFAQHIGLLRALQSVPLSQKQRDHSPQRKLLEFLVGILAGCEHLQDLSRSAHPLDQDLAVAQAWDQEGWADYSGVSRTLQGLTLAQADQITQALQEVSQPFLEQEITLALDQEQRLIYDGDLTGMPVSKGSKTYPGAAFGHMDDQIRLGYQAAVLSLRSPTYGRLWLWTEHHPGNTVAASVATAMIEAAEARTGRRPWRRTDLLQERLQQEQDYGNTLEQKLVQRQQKVTRAQEALQQVQDQVQAQQAHLQAQERLYQERQRTERPHSALAQTRQKLRVLQKRCIRREQALQKAREVADWAAGLVAQQRQEVTRLQARLERFLQENRTNQQPVRAVFRLDAGFGTYENLALLIESGYEVYSKVQNHRVVQSLQRQVPAEVPWTRVGQGAEMIAWAGRQVESFCYPLDVGLERFQTEQGAKYSALLHFGPAAAGKDLCAWFTFYNGRQSVEAGIKEGKHVFFLHRLKVRAVAAIVVQEQMVSFAANFLRWAQRWLRAGSPEADKEHAWPVLGMKELVQVAAHTSAYVECSAEGRLLRFTEQSRWAGRVLRLPGPSPLSTEKSAIFRVFQRFGLQLCKTWAQR